MLGLLWLIFKIQFSLIGIVGGIVIVSNPVGLASLTSGILILALGASIILGDVKCSEFLISLPKEQIEHTLPNRNQPAKYASFVEDTTPVGGRGSQIIVKTNEEIELYTPLENSDSICTSDFIDVPGVKKPNIWQAFREPGNKPKPRLIRRKCQREYVPLNQRTKTLSGLKFEDTTHNKQRAEPAIKRFQRRRAQILKENQ